MNLATSRTSSTRAAARAAAASLAASAIFAAAAPAIADESTARAAALFKEGREAMVHGNAATACPKFAESQRLDPAAGTLRNLALCEEAIGELAKAVVH